MPDVPRQLRLGRGGVLRLLDALDRTVEPDALTCYLTPDATLSPSLIELNDALAVAGDGRTGYVAFWGEQARLIVAPPFSVSRDAEFRGFVTEPLRGLLTAERTLGVILVRLGGYAVGIYRHGAFTVTKTGGRFVKNRHRKGGQSQRRFERIREGQIREHFDDVAEVIRTRLEPAAADLDGVVLGGDRHTVQALLTRAPLPLCLADKVLPRVIDVPEPRRDVLERSPVAIWTSRVVLLREPAATG